MSQHTQGMGQQVHVKIFRGLGTVVPMENGLEMSSKGILVQKIFFYIIHTNTIHILADKGNTEYLT